MIRSAIMPILHPSAAGDSLEPGLLSFRCNICDRPGLTRMAPLDRETPTCEGCGSNVSLRAIIQILSLELFGRSSCISEFPIRRDIVGLGISDGESDADGLARKFSDMKTYAHQEPHW